jgi:polyhydroxyalkanoate synthesis repressor PhaR
MQHAICCGATWRQRGDIARTLGKPPAGVNPHFAPQQTRRWTAAIRDDRVRAMAGPVLIKKYGNRRLYDTGDSRYITLEELTAKIRAGAEVRVVDAKTNEDLTQATLAQLILEGGSTARVLPVGLLTQLIRLGDDALGEFFSRYVTAALDIYLQAKRGLQSVSAYNPLAQLPIAATDALQRLWMSNPFAQAYGPPPGYGYPPPAPAPVPPPAAAPAPPEPGDEPRADDLAALRRELDELKQSLGRPGAKRKPRKD